MTFSTEVRVPRPSFLRLITHQIVLPNIKQLLVLQMVDALKTLSRRNIQKIQRILGCFAAFLRILVRVINSQGVLSSLALTSSYDIALVMPWQALTWLAVTGHQKIQKIIRKKKRKSHQIENWLTPTSNAFNRSRHEILEFSQGLNLGSSSPCMIHG